MNKSSLLELRDIYRVNAQFAANDPRARTLWRRMKKAYNTVPRNERGSGKLDAALARAMAKSLPST